MEVKPGNLLKFEPVDALKPPPPLGRTASTYGCAHLEEHPREGDIYTICRDGSVKLLSGEDERTIGWELVIKDDVAYARVAQYGFEPREVRVTHVGQLPGDMIPATSCVVGNTIQFARACTPDDQASHIGSISYATDEGVEVSSSFDADDFEIKPLDACPGAPLKEIHEYIGRVRDACQSADASMFTGDANLNTIARNLNPQLAAASSFLNDPVQTDAMARFAEGKMSYAEMRGLCG
jgi:hypothetical protein